MRRLRRLSRLGLCVCLAAASSGAAGVVAAPAAVPAGRVVSMNPSLTEILVALGAVGALVGVDEYSPRVSPEVSDLPTVGGLFNPSLEAVVALEPDLVTLVPSAQQRDFRRRLEALGIEVLALPNITFDQILDSIAKLGSRVGRPAEAAQRIAAIRAAWARAEGGAAGTRRVRAVLVLQRDPLFVVGRGSFLDAMLRAAGAENLGSGFSQPYPRAGIEWLIAAAPEVILDASDDPETAARYWARWPSLPAVEAGRAVAIPADLVTRPGPYLDRALARLREALTEGADAP